ncbi:protein kinase [Candidatus Uabimicrobium sp. HlEnr_7]|uniref:serine/threonine-protein kinase n=1 Tax=Candidatus Uabimicrobium helgolandensis TaxID=3095367 RepID=UPI003558A3AF
MDLICPNCKHNTQDYNQNNAQKKCSYCHQVFYWSSDKTYQSLPTTKSITFTGEYQGKQFGRYRIIEEIGRGGMGKVFKAQDIQLERIVALKILNSTALNAKKGLERFLREGKMMAKLSHPNIAMIYDIGFENKQPFLAMEFIAGQSLKDYMRTTKISILKTIDIMIKVCEAVHYAHEAGVIHRDLKPGNILLDANQQPKVLDFGLAKSVDSRTDLSQNGQVLGTVKYMSVEQANGDLSQIDAISDVYSLGVILYELLAGRAPFQNESLANLFLQILNEAPNPPSKYNKKIPPSLDKICLKSLSKDKKIRQQSARLLRYDLVRYTRKKNPRQSVRRDLANKNNYSVIIILVVCVLVSSLLMIAHFSSTSNEEIHKKAHSLKEKEKEKEKEKPKPKPKPKEKSQKHYVRLMAKKLAIFPEIYQLHKAAISADGEYIAFGGDTVNSVILAKTSGEILWQSQLPDDNYSKEDPLGTTESLVVSEHGDFVVVGSERSSITTFSKNGQLLWRKKLEFGEWQVATVNEKIYASAGKKLLCLTIKGERIWENDIDARDWTVWGICVSGDGKLIFIQTNSDIIVYDEYGKEKLFFDIVEGNNIIAADASSDGSHFTVLYANQGSWIVTLYHIEKGLQWTKKVEESGDIAIDNSYRVFFACGQNYLWDSKGNLLISWEQGGQALDVSNSGKQVVTGSSQHGGMVYSIEKRKK